MPRWLDDQVERTDEEEWEDMNSAFDAFNAKYAEVASVTAALQSGSYRDLLNEPPDSVSGEHDSTGGGVAATAKLESND